MSCLRGENMTARLPFDIPSQCKLMGLPVPVREFKFHPSRRWRVDYFFKDFGLAIEIEGGVWTKGRHIRGSGFLKDAEKYNNLTLLGYRLLRFTPQQERNGEAIEVIKHLIG